MSERDRCPKCWAYAKAKGDTWIVYVCFSADTEDGFIEGVPCLHNQLAQVAAEQAVLLDKFTEVSARHLELQDENRRLRGVVDAARELREVFRGSRYEDEVWFGKDLEPLDEALGALQDAGR